MLPYPAYWFRPEQRVATSPGHHRFVWDLRYPPPRGAMRQDSIAAVYRNTPSGPHGPFVAPGRYTVRLTVDGERLERPLDVRLDPRVTLGEGDLRMQTDLSLRCYRGYLHAQEMREAIDAVLGAGSGDDGRQDARRALRGAGAPAEPDLLYGSITAVPDDRETVVGLQQKFLFMLSLLQAADARPTTQARAAVPALERTLAALEARWAALRETRDAGR